MEQPKPTAPRIENPVINANYTDTHTEEKEQPDNVDVEVDFKDDSVNKEDNDDENNMDEKKDEDDEKKDTEKPLLEDDSVKIDIAGENEGEDTATLPISDKKKNKTSDDTKVEIKKGKLPKYLFPISRMKNAWNNSANMFEFLGKSTYIIFSTVGWFTCVGGVPFISLAMLIIGCLYIGDCNAQPNIPIYLIISGLFGTIQHVISIWTSYIPRNSEGRLPVYRKYCRFVNCLLHGFLLIWFILGCIWVYGIHDHVVFRDTDKEEYCNKTVYYFAFWILNLSFILLGIVVVLSLCGIICLVTTPKEESHDTTQGK